MQGQGHATHLLLRAPTHAGLSNHSLQDVIATSSDHDSDCAQALFAAGLRLAHDFPQAARRNELKCDRADESLQHLLI